MGERGMRLARANIALVLAAALGLSGCGAPLTIDEARTTSLFPDVDAEQPPAEEVLDADALVALFEPVLPPAESADWSTDHARISATSPFNDAFTDSDGTPYNDRVVATFGRVLQSESSSGFGDGPNWTVWLDIVALEDAAAGYKGFSDYRTFFGVEYSYSNDSGDLKEVWTAVDEVSFAELPVDSFAGRYELLGRWEGDLSGWFVTARHDRYLLIMNADSATDAASVEALEAYLDEQVPATVARFLALPEG